MIGKVKSQEVRLLLDELVRMKVQKETNSQKRREQDRKVQ
jgi:hypothetical protein